MAKRGTNKDLSVRHEERIAAYYGGKRSPSSGGADNDAGDVRVRAEGVLFECKYTGSPAKPLKRKPGLVTKMEKIADEAWAEGRDPALALRFYWPESPLADGSGHVDLSVRLTPDDAQRSAWLSD